MAKTVILSQKFPPLSDKLISNKKEDDLMAIDVKQYLYTKGMDSVLDADFDLAKD